MGGRRQHVRDQGAISEHLDRLGMSIDEGLVETGLIHHTLDLVEKGTSCSVKARSHRFDRLQVLDPTSGRRARRSRSSTCPSRRSDGRGEIAGGVIVDTREGEHDVSIQNSSRDPKATWWMEMHIVFRGGVIGRPLQQDPPPELTRCLARRGSDQSIEVVAGQESARRQVRPSHLVVVQPIGDMIYEPEEVVGR